MRDTGDDVTGTGQREVAVVLADEPVAVSRALGMGGGEADDRPVVGDLLGPVAAGPGREQLSVQRLLAGAARLRARMGWRRIPRD